MSGLRPNRRRDNATKAPKARAIPAWGNAPGMDARVDEALKARAMDASVPHILLVKRDSVPFEKRAQFILKTMFPMMRFLLADVFEQGIQIRGANRERAISTLPRELRKPRRFGLQPSGRRGFQFLNNVSNRFRARKTNGKMHVISNASDAITFASGIASDGGKIRVQFNANVFVQICNAVLRTEDNVNQQKTQRLGHSADYRSGLQPSAASRAHTWGVAPGWYRVAPLALILAFASAVSLNGCKSTSTPSPAAKTSAPAVTYPPHPTAAPPSIQLFHHTNDSITLVTDEHATDEQIEAILWQLHDAAKAHSFDQLGIPQKLVDARDPIVWFHLYRGSKCASEKYTTGKLPCGASYHAAGDYTLGGFTDHNHDDGLLIRSETDQVHLW